MSLPSRGLRQPIRHSGSPDPKAGLRRRTGTLSLSLQIAAAATLIHASIAEPLGAQAVAGPPLTLTGSVVEEPGIGAAGVEVTLRPYPSNWEHGIEQLTGSGALADAVDGARTGWVVLADRPDRWPLAAGDSAGWPRG